MSGTEYYADDASQYQNQNFSDFLDDDDDDDNDDDYEHPENTNKFKFNPNIPNGDEIEFMNEEEETSTNNKYKNKFNEDRLDYLEKRQRKKNEKEKLLKEIFDDDDDDDEKNDSSGDDNKDINENKDENDDDDDEFFTSKHKTNHRYFHKNTNDAIKIISTPNGKVGIVYQQTKNVTSTAIATEQKLLDDIQKITPVLTADGKVALLYRGDSKNSKYEPILNQTIFENIQLKPNSNDNNDNKTSAAIELNLDKIINGKKKDDEEEEEDLGYDEDDERLLKNNKIQQGEQREKEILVSATIIQTEHLSRQLEIEYENPILPIINRPLSEVLGIKKNQFKQFRIKDIQTTLPTTTTWSSIVNEDDNDDDDNENNNNDDIDEEWINNNNNNQNNNNYDSSLSSSSSSSYDYKIDAENQIDLNRPADEATNDDDNDFLSKTEVVNLAIIPHFDEDFEILQQQQRYREQYAAASGNNLHHRYRYRNFNQDLSGIHCIMQAMMGLAAISTVFGMLGAFFKQRILDQIRLMHW